MYTFLGITLVLALLLTINATATMVAAGVGRLCKPLLWKCSARTRAEILFVMRIGPPVIAIVAIAAFMIPSYLAYEPHATKEVVSFKLGALATLSAIGVGLAISRIMSFECQVPFGPLRTRRTNVRMKSASRVSAGVPCCHSGSGYCAMRH